MAKSKFTLKTYPAGFNQARNDPRAQQKLHEMGERIAEAAASSAGLGEDAFVVVDSPNATRARTVVITATPAAMEAEATRRSLSAALTEGSR